MNDSWTKVALYIAKSNNNIFYKTSTLYYENSIDFLMDEAIEKMHPRCKIKDAHIQVKLGNINTSGFNLYKDYYFDKNSLEEKEYVLREIFWDMSLDEMIAIPLDEIYDYLNSSDGELKKEITWKQIIVEIAKELNGYIIYQDDDFTNLLTEKIITYHKTFKDTNELWEVEKAKHRVISANLAVQGDANHLFYMVRKGEWKLKDEFLDLSIDEIIVIKPPKKYFTKLKVNKIKSEEQELKTNKKITDTEREAIIKTRVGQSEFRQDLIAKWGGCSVCGFSQASILIASHIKPWSKSDDDEKLDIYNGLLLIPTLDKLFDKGYISFSDDGKIMISSELKDYEKLGVSSDMFVKLEDEHKLYMKYHREHEFIK